MEQTNKKLLFGIAALILIFLAGIMFLNFARKPKSVSIPVLSPTETQQTVAPSTGQQAQPTLPPIVVPTSESIVILTSNGFEPKTITVKQKTLVIWRNKSGSDSTISSDDHPTHKKYPPLNRGIFKNGETIALTFDKPGTYGYHDHFHPTRTGTVIVSE